MLQRNGVFFFRKVVPVALRAIVGKREILVSLKTKDREQAKRKLHREALKDATLAAARRELGQQTPEMLAERWKHDLLREDAETRSAFKPKTKADLDSEIADLDATLAEVRSYLTFGNMDEVRESTLAAVEKYGAKLTADSPEMPQVAHALLRAGAEALGILRRRALGDWSDPPSPLAPVLDTKTNPPLSLVLDSWLAERKPPSKTARVCSTTSGRTSFAHVSLPASQSLPKWWSACQYPSKVSPLRSFQFFGLSERFSSAAFHSSLAFCAATVNRSNSASSNCSVFMVVLPVSRS
jgi:hypothetical protein